MSIAATAARGVARGTVQAAGGLMRASRTRTPAAAIAAGMSSATAALDSSRRIGRFAWPAARVWTHEPCGAAAHCRQLSGGAPELRPPAQAVIVDQNNFNDVVMESRGVVVLQCTAEWCQPCKQLSPKLEHAVGQCDGVVLARMDIDECQEIAGAMNIDVVPTLFLIRDKKVITKVTGDLTDAQIADFLAKGDAAAKQSDAAKTLAQAGEHLAAGEIEPALQAYGRVLEADKEKYGAVAMAGMALCALALRDFDGAMLLIKKIRTEHPMQVTEPLVEQAVSAVDMAVASQKLDGEVPSLEEALAKDAGDHAARAKLATALFGRGQYKAAMDHALEIVKRDKTWENGKGRELLVGFFTTLGPSHPDVTAARRRLSTLLFI